MGALMYLTLLKAKNKIREILKSPSQLIMLGIFAFFILFSFFGPQSQGSDQLRSIQELYASVFMLYSYTFVFTAKTGFYNGASMFSMADVNLLFTAPFKSSSVLFFGLMQQLTRSILLGGFLLYQSQTLKRLYGVGADVMIFIFLGYAITLFLSQMVAMLIYTFTSSDDKKSNALKAVFNCVVGAFVVSALIFSYKADGLSLVSLYSAVNEKLFFFFPVSGIVKAGVVYAAEKQYLYSVVCLLITVLLVGMFYLCISKKKADYYEDVLSGAETSFSAITARKEGKVSEDAPKNIRLGKTGFTKGFGANAVYYKHKIENRRGKVFMLGTSSIVFILVSAVYCFFVKDMPVVAFTVNCYLLIFSIAYNRWSKELNYPYIYLIPESAIKKLFYMLLADFPSLAVESLLSILPICFFSKLSAAETAAMVVARISVGILITGVNLLFQRFTGSSKKTVFSVLIYFAMISVFILPSAMLAILLGTALPFNREYAYLVFAAGNFIIGLVVMFASRTVLEYAEYNNK